MLSFKVLLVDDHALFRDGVALPPRAFLHESPGGCFGPAERARIAFESDRDGSPEIYVMNSDGSGQTRLTNDPASDTRPDCSPDCTRIVFASGNGSNRELCPMAADGTGRIQLTFDPATASQPAWSPDGTRSAFDGFPVCSIGSDGSDFDDLSGGFSAQEGFSLAWRPAPEPGLGMGLALGVLRLGALGRRR